MPSMPPVLGIRANLAQFSLLVVVNAFVGAMIGIERSRRTPPSSRSSSCSASPRR
jgi:hypothetical protein